MRLLLSALLATGFALAAPVPKEAKKTVAERLVGTWKLTKSDDAGTDYTFLVEFTKDGKITAKYEFGGENAVQTLEGKFKLDGDDKIEYTLGDRGETLTIKTLTDDELVVVDPEKKVEEFKRVKEKETKEAPK